MTSTIYSADARFVLCGSDDGNVRIWKAKASEKLGIVTARERASMEYRESLMKRWSVDKDVGKVMRCVSTLIFNLASTDGILQQDETSTQGSLQDGTTQNNDA